MQSFTYLIIGGGITADSAVHGIRETDKEGSICLISNESRPPYNRPPLSKALWKGESEEVLLRNTDKENITLMLGTSAVSLDVKSRSVTDDKGQEYGYEKLLIATGGTVNKLPYDEKEIIYFRTYRDYQNLRKLTEGGKDFLVIGGGFIGAEISAALCMNQKNVTLVFPGPGLCSGIFPASLSNFLNKYYEEKGVHVITEDQLDSLDRTNTRFKVRTKGGKRISVDGLVAGIGIRPETYIAESAGLLVDNGIKVNELLQTSDPDIYAAGDVANFYNAALDKHIRFEHEDNANRMGMLAGRNMAGAGIPYQHLPGFYSDLFDLGYEAVGDLNAGYETIEQWKEPFREGIIYYLHHNRLKGVLLWNTWDQVEKARELIISDVKFDDKSILNVLPK